MIEFFFMTEEIPTKRSIKNYVLFFLTNFVGFIFIFFSIFKKYIPGLGLTDFISSSLLFVIGSLFCFFSPFFLYKKTEYFGKLFCKQRIFYTLFYFFTILMFILSSYVFNKNIYIAISIILHFTSTTLFLFSFTIIK